MKKPAFQSLLQSSYAIWVHCANLMALIKVSCTSPNLPAALIKPSKNHTLKIASVYPLLLCICCSGTFLSAEIKVKCCCRISD